jgi:hypothetical protein
VGAGHRNHDALRGFRRIGGGCHRHQVKRAAGPTAS